MWKTYKDEKFEVLQIHTEGELHWYLRHKKTKLTYEFHGNLYNTLMFSGNPNKFTPCGIERHELGTKENHNIVNCEVTEGYCIFDGSTTHASNFVKSCKTLSELGIPSDDEILSYLYKLICQDISQ